MAEMDLSEGEATRLLGMEKRAVDQTLWAFPDGGGKLTIPLISVDRREHFLLDLTRSQIKLTKATYQHRARVAVVLSRLDIDGAPHRNPDGQEIPCPHLHIYRQGYGVKWAIPAPPDEFPDVSDLFATLNDFMEHCNVTEFPLIQKGLFS